MPWNQGLQGPFLAIGNWEGSPLRVLAGPGTGKTFALMRRVARLLESGTDPETVFVVTFTRAAALDLVAQLEELEVEGTDGVVSSTLHSAAFGMLVRAQVLAATGRTPRTLVDFEIECLVRDLSRTEFRGVREKKRRLRAFEAAWARLQDDRPGWPTAHVDRNFQRDLLQWLLFHEGMLVGELIPVALRYLRENPLAPERGQFQHVLVDEYQDLNRAEQVLIDFIANGADLTVVGDDDQSIYSFKFAHPEGIIDFPETHPETHDEQLTHCRRCPRTIIEMANNLISNNPRIERELVPAGTVRAGEVWAVQWETLDEEASGVAGLVQNAVEERGVSVEDVIVLATRKLIGYRIRDALREMDLPVRSYFSEQALESELAKERLTLFSLIANPEDRVSLRTWLGLRSPSYLTGEYRRLWEYCIANGDHPRRVLEQLSAGRIRIPHTTRILRRFRQLEEATAALQGLRGADFVQGLLPPDDENLEELRNLAIGTLPVTDDPVRIYNELRYKITQPEIPTSPDSIRVMSLHKSKGLTARLVIVAGVLNGVLPAIDRRLSHAEQQRDLQEQRRLFYVAITRSSDILIISAALNIDRHTASRIGATGPPRRGMVRTTFSQFYDELGAIAPAIVTGEQVLEGFAAGVQVD